MGIDLALWHCFVTVAEHGSINRAATALRMDQPGLSRAIRRLEKKIGAPLFEREPKGVRLTPVGAHLLPSAQELLVSADELTARAVALARESRRQLRVGTLEFYPFTTALAATRRALARNSPPILLELIDLPWFGHVTAVLRRTVDVGFTVATDREISQQPLLTFAVIRDEPQLYAVLPADHPLAEQREVSPAQLRHEPLFLPHRLDNPEAYDRILTAVIEAGWDPAGGIRETRSLGGALQDIALGTGWTVAASGIGGNPVPGTIALPLHGQFLNGVRLVAFWLQSNKAASIPTAIARVRREVSSLTRARAVLKDQPAAPLAGPRR
jgi:DNA-binding transcriptional LysR family regulator